MLLTPALLFALTLGQSLPPWMTGESHADDLDVWCVTFSPGDSLTEWWGHTALVVQDRRLNHARLYNYGMFSFGEGFVDRFLQGRLEFWVADDSVAGTFRLYQYLNRDIRIQELNLLPEQAMLVAKTLGENVLPQNRMYLYQHYTDNCSTRPRDIIDAAVGGQLLKASTAPARMSLRDLTRRYSMVSPPMSLVLDYLQNDELERPITKKDEAFLPDELERQLQALQITRPDGSQVPLVKKQYNAYTAKNREPPPEWPPNWVPYLLALGLVAGGTPFFLLSLERNRKTGARRRWPRVLFGTEQVALGLGWGVLGLVLFIMGVFTNQTVTHRNENLFLINPLTFLAMPFGVMLAFGSQKARTLLRWTWTVLAATAMLGVLLKLLPVFNQANWNLIALVLPVNVSMAAAWWFDYRLQQTP